MSHAHVLILGGARSGKSAYAEKLALSLAERPAYLATSQAFDDEMRARIATHQTNRNARFETIEEPLDLVAALTATRASHDVVLVDCLTLWISNLMASESDVDAAVDSLVETLGTITDTRIIIVSNEVGMGIVPDNAMARAFRDHAGRAHQKLGKTCTDVTFVAAGLPLAMKGEVADFT